MVGAGPRDLRLRFGDLGLARRHLFTGGATTVNGAEKDDRQENWRVGATLAVPLAANHAIKLYASTGVSARTGNDFDLFGIAYQLRWGGGL